MQRYFLIAILIVLAGIISSCSHNSKEQAAVINKASLPGTWELRGVTGGMVIPNPDDFKPGNGNIWKFTSDYFERIYHDSVDNSGTYFVTPTGVDLNTNRTISQFVLNNTPAESFDIKNDTLNIYYGAMAWDGDIQHYVKIADAH